MSQFGSAFKAARKAGKKEFTWNGKRYTTKLASEGTKKTPTPSPRPSTSDKEKDRSVTQKPAPRPTPRPSVSDKEKDRSVKAPSATEAAAARAKAGKETAKRVLAERAKRAQTKGSDKLVAGAVSMAKSAGSAIKKAAGDYDTWAAKKRATLRIQ